MNNKENFCEIPHKQEDWERKYGRIRPLIQISANGTTFIAVGSRLFSSKNWRTFPDFLMDYLKLVLGSEWWSNECSKDPKERHFIVKWCYDIYEFQKKQIPRENGIYSSIPTGPYSAVIHIAYDLYILEHHLKLHRELVRRLKIPDQFQGARYELFAVATCFRAGFDIEFEDEKNRQKKHPEFIATHRMTGQKIAVEAKSRHRSGVLGQKGSPIDSPRADIGNILNKAFLKKPDYPYVVFLDVNLPPSEKENFTRPWINQIIKTISHLCDEKQKDRFNLLLFTNIPHHYGDTQSTDPKKAFIWTFSNNPCMEASHRGALDEIPNAAMLYTNIPNKLPF